jgi:hypothetical protein
VTLSRSLTTSRLMIAAQVQHEEQLLAEGAARMRELDRLIKGDGGWDNDQPWPEGCVFLSGKCKVKRLAKKRDER